MWLLTQYTLVSGIIWIILLYKKSTGIVHIYKLAVSSSLILFLYEEEAAMKILGVALFATTKAVAVPAAQ